MVVLIHPRSAFVGTVNLLYSLNVVQQSYFASGFLIHLLAHLDDGIPVL